MNELKNEQAVVLSDPASKQTVFKYEKGKIQSYYFVEPQTQELQQIEQAKKRVKKTIFTLSAYEDHFPKNILIHHFDVKLNIQLQLLKR